MTVKGLIKAKNDIYMVKRTTLKKKLDGKFFQHFFEIFLRNSAEINPKFFLEIFRNFHIKKLTRNLFKAFSLVAAVSFNVIMI